MNWMGGVRNRLKVRNERKRQQDFFEKQKFTNKQRKVENKTYPQQKKQPVSLDLVSLQAANFSAAHFKKNGYKKISSGRVNRVDLDKSRGLFRQKFVNLPDASPETKPSALILNKPSPQESVNPLLTSRRHTLSTITEDSSYSLIESDISNQDLSQMLPCKTEPSHFLTSTPADFWHKKKGKRSNRHNTILDAKCSSRQLDDHEQVFHSPSTSEKLLLNSSTEQMRTIDGTGSGYWASKTPGSNTSGWSDLSTIMEDTDEATVPSMDDDDDDEWDQQHVGRNQVSSQCQTFPETIQSHDVPTSKWTLEMASEESLLEDSTLSSFKDYHKIEYPPGGSEMEDSTRFTHQTASEQYSSNHPMKVEWNIRNLPQSEHIAIDSQPGNELSRDPLTANKVRKRVHVVDERHNRNHKRDHTSKGKTSRPTDRDSLLHEYADSKDEKDLACHESTSFTSPEDSSGTYLMTERAKMDYYKQHLNVQDSKADQTHHRYTRAHQSINTNHISKGDHDQTKMLQINRTDGDKVTTGQIQGHFYDQQVNIINLYSCDEKQNLPVGVERVDIMQDQPCSKVLSNQSQTHDKDRTLPVDNQYSDGGSTSEDDAESSGSSVCSSTDDSPDMDLADGTNASCHNWLEFVHADVSEVNRTGTVRKDKEFQGDERQIKDVPATAQQMLEEVLALDRELHKEMLEEDIGDVSKNTLIPVDGRDRTVEKMSDKQIETAKDNLLGLQDIESQVPDLKTASMLASITRNAKPKEMEREQKKHGDLGITVEDRQANIVNSDSNNNISSSQTEETEVTFPQAKSPGMTTKAALDNSESLVSQAGDVSTTVVFMEKDSGSALPMPLMVPTSTSAKTVADSNTQGEKILCDSCVQCTLIGDPLPMHNSREWLDVLSVHSSDDVTMPSLEVMVANDGNNSNTDTMSSQENEFESCASTP